MPAPFLRQDSWGLCQQTLQRNINMISLALSFNEVKFNPVTQSNGQIYLTASELAQALNYKSVKSVSNLYNSNKDEFTSSMSLVIESLTPQNVEVIDSVTSKQTRNLIKKIRIFSLRGCHLIAMFARTNVAKQFRKWALDILDKEVSTPTTKTHKSEREPLTNAVNMLVAKTKHLNYSDAYKLVHQRFSVDHIEDIPYGAIPVAVEYVHHLIAFFGNKENKNNDLHISGLAQAMIWVNHWWKEYGEGIRTLNPNIANSVHDYFVDGSIVAWRFVRETEKTSLKNQLLSHQWNLTASERFKLV